MINSTENWCHLNPEILKAGCVKHSAPEGLDEDTTAEFIENLEASDPVTERLRGLAEDTRKLFLVLLLVVLVVVVALFKVHF